MLLEGYFRIPATELCLMTLERSGPEEKRFELDYLRRRLEQGPDYCCAARAVPPKRRRSPSLPRGPRRGKRRILDALEQMALTLTDGSRILLSADRHLVPTYHPNFERGLPGMSVLFDRA